MVVNKASSTTTGSVTGSDVSGWNETASDTGLSEVEYGIEPNVAAGLQDEERRQQQKGQQLQGTNRQVGGAAVAAGIAGTLLVGPVIGLVAAGGAAVVATKKGTAGNVARASGDVVANAGERIRKFDQNHHVTKKVGKGFVKGAKFVSSKLKVKDSKEGQAANNLTA